MALRIALLVAALSLALPAASPAATAKPPNHLWATVNVCDTPNKPHTIGIRARMPGNGRPQQMWMRFRTQFWSTTAHSWRNVTRGGASPWVRAGSARFLYRESGYEFQFDAPAAGQSFRLRGMVDFQWREGRKVSRATMRATSGGHRTHGADPKNFSAPECEIKGPPAPKPR
jgi:hypothetical protein